MAVQSSFGKVRWFEDFTGIGATAAIADATAGTRYNDICLVAISGQTDLDYTVTQGNGVISFTGAGGAADGIALLGPPFRPSLSAPAVIEARFRIASATDMRVFLGFQQTVSLAETVNPFTLSGTTLTANAAGEVVGFYADSQATTDDFRFMSGSNSSASTGARVVCGPLVAGLNSNATTLGSLGIRSGVTFTATSWYTARVEMFPDGSAIGYFGHESMLGGNIRGLIQVARLLPGDLSTSVYYFPHLHLAAQSTGDPLLEVDYFGGSYNRDWAA